MVFRFGTLHLARRGLRAAFAVALGASLLAACARHATPVVMKPVASDAPGAPHGPAPFAPGRANPELRSRLAALAPRLNAHYRAELEQQRATGAVVGIVLEGELVYTGSFGVRDVETQAPVDADTVFRIASMTKSFTASAVMKLRDEGKIVLDAPIATYLPEAVFRSQRDGVPITTRHLLTMTSGLPYDDQWGAVTFGYSDAELAALLRSGVALAHPPGEAYAYSNLGYALLAAIVERVSGVLFREYVTKNLLAPLGMTSTVWDAPDKASARLALGYHRDGDVLTQEPRPGDGVFAAAGGLYTSLNDYARYVAFQLAAYPARDDPETGPLRRSTLREMHTGERWMRWTDDAPVAWRTPDGRLSLSSAAYGFGWANHSTCFYEGLVQHGGAEPGYSSYVRLLPKEALGIVTFSTTASIGSLKSFETVFGMLRDAGVLAPRKSQVAPELARAGSTLGRLLHAWDDSLVERTFDPQSLRYSWVKKLASDFARLAREHGRCEPEAAPEPYDPSHARFRFACERGKIAFTVWLTPTVPPRIQALEWKEQPSTAAHAAPDELGKTCSE
jgi:CubicO group peptidase (beta-lactamase class C family)